MKRFTTSLVIVLFSCANTFAQDIDFEDVGVTDVNQTAFGGGPKTRNDLSAVSASAPSLVLNATQFQTVDFENFTFTFNGVLPAAGVDGTLTIHARGDYDPGTATEFLEWDIDSLGIGGSAGPTIGGVSIIQNNGINDVEWEQDFTILGSDLSAITADSTVQIMVDLNGNGGGGGVHQGFQPDEFVEVTLEFDLIPEPSTFGLAGFGLLVMGYFRRSRA